MILTQEELSRADAEVDVLIRRIAAKTSCGPAMNATKEIEAFRASSTVVSKPGAVIEVRSYPIPERLAEKISAAIKAGTKA